MRIISLTSIPSRFPLIGDTLDALLLQDADLVCLYIPQSYRRFPDWDGNLPMVPKGVRIRRCNIDYGPATKILPAAIEFAEYDCQILFCDDDCSPPNGWANRLFSIQNVRHNQVVACYGRRSYPYSQASTSIMSAVEVPIQYDIRYRFLNMISRFRKAMKVYKRPIWKRGYVDVFFGVGGVVVNPRFFDKTAFDIPDIAWFVDDIWLSAVMARQGIKIYCPALAALPLSNKNSKINPLLSHEYNEYNRKELNIMASEYCRNLYKIWI